MAGSSVCSKGALEHSGSVTVRGVLFTLALLLVQVCGEAKVAITKVTAVMPASCSKSWDNYFQLHLSVADLPPAADIDVKNITISATIASFCTPAEVLVSWDCSIVANTSTQLICKQPSENWHCFVHEKVYTANLDLAGRVVSSKPTTLSFMDNDLYRPVGDVSFVPRTRELTWTKSRAVICGKETPKKYTVTYWKDLLGGLERKQKTFQMCDDCEETSRQVELDLEPFTDYTLTLTYIPPYSNGDEPPVADSPEFKFKSLSAVPKPMKLIQAASYNQALEMITIDIVDTINLAEVLEFRLRIAEENGGLLESIRLAYSYGQLNAKLNFTINNSEITQSMYKVALYLDRCTDAEVPRSCSDSLDEGVFNHTLTLRPTPSTAPSSDPTRSPSRLSDTIIIVIGVISGVCVILTLVLFVLFCKSKNPDCLNAENPYETPRNNGHVPMEMHLPIQEGETLEEYQTRKAVLFSPDHPPPLPLARGNNPNTTHYDSAADAKCKFTSTSMESLDIDFTDDQGC